MKRIAILSALAVLFVGVTVCLADSPQMGTWNLNEAKSHFAPKATKNKKVVYEAATDGVKVTVDGTDGDGNATHNDWTGKFDGTFYKVDGDPTSDMRSYKKINNHTLALTAKKGKKVTLTGRVVVSADGKTRTVTTTGTDSKGKRVTNRAVYDKE
jgi:hypothetical protein